ncbi:MAG: D-Ala-D-Ala carboxypeptidase family metallohydrolase [Candidatus Dojkabacteria bacterium]|jgi:uncharacterized protein YcbK (DUF882 family)|nr:D-Ala-D-Ala carboxypeptidase family metallohydrolase [Candidatus Dojkabacteria bacterium]MDX9738894.1 D-Ala-D-Ala carboxypeptidase family metallohydrolase [Candidatus Dojkabacteria bacterium]
MVLLSIAEAKKWFEDNSSRIKDFELDEFTCKCGCGTLKLNTEVIEGAQDLRNEIGPVYINSGYRCPKHNKAVGGKEDSQHLDGNAIDIVAADSSMRYKVLMSNAIRKHFKGIGINFNKGFIHMDKRNITGLVFPY